jgi:hypothetical protein
VCASAQYTNEPYTPNRIEEWAVETIRPEDLLKPNHGPTLLWPVSSVLAPTIAVRRSVHLGSPRAVWRSFVTPLQSHLNAPQTSAVLLVTPLSLTRRSSWRLDLLLKR